MEQYMSGAWYSGDIRWCDNGWWRYVSVIKKAQKGLCCDDTTLVATLVATLVMANNMM